MPNRREFKGRIAALNEIDGILGAMKNLSLMEIQKLDRFIVMQQRVVAGVEAAVADFLTFYPAHATIGTTAREAYLLVGSERGFCGNFNDTLIAAYRELQLQPSGTVIAVGHKLADRLSGLAGESNTIAGAGVVEEIESVLTALAESLDRLQRDNANGGPLGLTILYHDHESEAVKVQRLLPMPDLPGPAGILSFAPLLTLQPAQILPKLVEQYLSAALHAVLYRSLLAENQHRLAHMDGAMRRLERDLGEIKVKYNSLRQEEIIEEIEVILLSTEALAAD